MRKIIDPPKSHSKFEERVKERIRVLQEMGAIELQTNTVSNNNDTHESKIIDQRLNSIEVKSMTPGQRLRLWRKERNLTIKQLATIAEIDAIAILKYESGMASFSAKDLKYLGELGLDLNWLLCDKGQCYYAIDPLLKEIGYIAEILDADYRAILLEYADYLKAKQSGTLISEKVNHPSII